MHAHFTMPEIEFGLLAVVVLGAAAITIFLVVALARAAARTAWRCIFRMTRNTVPDKTLFAAERTR